jgi:SAM-dependent methyltransferase
MPQVISKTRVAEYGEVLTGRREVNAMLDLVKQETARIESRFLEPACGTGNFLAEILERKLTVIARRYRRSQLEYERNCVVAVSSIYGIDILPDNVAACRKRLFGIFDWKYGQIFKKKTKNECRESVRYILKRNIVHGDALTLKMVGAKPTPIIFSEWSPFKNMLKRKDFAFRELMPDDKKKAATLFSEDEKVLYSDLGEKVFMPEPLKEYPLAHFLKISDAKKQ